MGNHYVEAQRVFRDEAAALLRTMDAVCAVFDLVVDLILDCRGKVVTTGIGKSGIIAHKVSATLASTGTPSVFLNAGESLHGDLGIVGPEDVVLFFSNSGNTQELARMVPSIRKIGARSVGVFGRPNGSLVPQVDVSVDLSVEKEACPLNLAPMTSATVSLVFGDALASALIRARNFTAEDFAVYHPGGDLGRRLLLRVEDVMHSIGESVPTVTPAMTLREALVVMNRSNLGGVIVIEGEQVVGVFTDGDLRRCILQDAPLDKVMATLMTPDPITIPRYFALGKALDLMEQSGRKIYFAPVVDSNLALLGALRMHDILSD